MMPSQPQRQGDCRPSCPKTTSPASLAGSLPSPLPGPSFSAGWPSWLRPRPRIEAQVWPNYDLANPGPSVNIRFALSFLNGLGYVTPDPGEEFDQEMHELITEFDSDHNLADDSKLESETWIKIRNMHFPTEGHSYQYGERDWAVVGIRAILNEKYGAGLEENNGLYDRATENAVKAAQRDCGVKDDGAFGRLSYKCVLTKGNNREAADTAQAPVEGAEAPAEEAPVEETPAEDAERVEELSSY